MYRLGSECLKVSESCETIICPKCHGNGKIQHTERVSWTEDAYWEELCNYCKGKRIVSRRTIIEDHEVEDLEVDTERRVY